MSCRRSDANVDCITDVDRGRGGEERRLELRRLADHHAAATSCGTFNEHWELAPDQRAVTFERERFLKRNNLSQAAALFFVTDSVAKFKSARMLAHRILEHKRRVVTDPPHEVERGGEITFLLTMKTHDDIGRQGQIWNSGP